MTIQGWDLLVGKDDLHRTRIEPVSPPTPGEGEILLRVESFALTANNITYAVFGEQMAYWRFFPAAEGWGRIPVWGYGVVERSGHPQIAVGERFYGYYPMSSHMTARPRKTRTGFIEESPHRIGLPAAYNQYQLAPADAPHQDERSLLNPLFMTSFLIEDFLDDNALFGARSVVLSSASSKTALGLAHRLSKRGGLAVVGLTSPGNRAFVEGLGVYDQVVLYEDLKTAPIAAPVVFVDFAGDAAVLAGVHERFGDDLVHSCLVGGTHWEAEKRASGALPGPKPVFFFAPDRIAKRREDWGPGGLEARYAGAWDAFVADAGRWMTIDRVDGPEAIAAIYMDVLDGRSRPDRGVICRP